MWKTTGLQQNKNSSMETKLYEEERNELSNEQNRKEKSPFH
jgi:hypothetical protein